MNYDFNNEKQIEYRTNHMGMYIFLFISLILAGLLGYNYYAYEMTDKSEFKQDYIKKENITFDDLPSYIKSDYISNFQHNQKLNELALKKEQKTKTIQKVVEVEKIVKVEVPKIVKVTQAVDKSKYNSYSCYEMINEYSPSKNCIIKLQKFLDKNKDSKLFEVIGISTNEKIEKTLDEKTKMLIKKGLTQKRVEEAVWEVKKHLGIDTNVQSATYDVKDSQKGFAIRAYK